MSHLWIRNVEKIAITGGCSSKSKLLDNLQSALCLADMIILRQNEYSPAADLFWQSIVDYISQEPEFADQPIVFNGRSLIDLPSTIGMHFKSNRFIQMQDAINTNVEKKLIGISCHSIIQAEAAATSGADYILISPIKTPQSHAQYAANIGWQGLRAVTKKVNLPVYALGGMTLVDLQQAKSNGASGIASISAFLSQNIYSG